MAGLAMDPSVPLWIGAALDAAVDGVLIETDGRISYINRAYATMLGYHESGELVGVDVGRVIATADADRLLTFADERHDHRSPPSHYEFDARRKDGSAIRLHASVGAAEWDGRCFIITFVRPARTEEQSAFDEALLSLRERDVVHLLLAGVRPKEIAFRLKISVKTVATHQARAFRKLGVPDIWNFFRVASSLARLGSR